MTKYLVTNLLSNRYCFDGGGVFCNLKVEKLQNVCRKYDMHSYNYNLKLRKSYYTFPKFFCI